MNITVLVTMLFACGISFFIGFIWERKPKPKPQPQSCYEHALSHLHKSGGQIYFPNGEWNIDTLTCQNFRFVSDTEINVTKDKYDVKIIEQHKFLLKQWREKHPLKSTHEKIIFYSGFDEVMYGPPEIKLDDSIRSYIADMNLEVYFSGCIVTKKKP